MRDRLRRRSADAQALNLGVGFGRRCRSRDAGPFPRCVPLGADRSQLTLKDSNLGGEAANLALQVIHGPLCPIDLGAGSGEFLLPLFYF